MATISINGTSFTTLAEGFAGGSLTAGIYTALAPYGEPPQISSPETEEMLITYFGVPGVGSKQGGYRGTDIIVELIAAGSSKSDAQAKVESVINNLPTNVRFDVVPDGGATIHGCKLKRGGGRVKKWFTIDNIVCALFVIELRSWSTTN